MGQLFSATTSSSTTNYEEIQKQSQELESEQQNLIQESENLTKKSEELYQEIITNQEAIRLKRKKELDKLEERAQELKNYKATVYLKASRCICELLFNIETGIYTNNETNLKNFYNNIFNTCYGNDVFWLLCKIPIIIPIIWPTGYGDDKFHNHDSTINSEKYKIIVDTYIDDYIKNKLITICINSSLSNILRYDSQNIISRTELGTNCDEYITSISNLTDDTNWVKTTINYLRSTSVYSDYYTWRLLRSKAYKGICSTSIKYLPQNYPIYNNEYEFREAIMLITNVIMMSYGRILDINGNYITVNSVPNKVPDNASILGGKCFDINITNAKKEYEDSLKAFDDKSLTNPWDGITYKKVNSDMLLTNGIENVTYKSYDKLRIYKLYNNNTKSYQNILAYTNPTQCYTQIIMQDQELDTDTIDTNNQTILASINCDNTSNLIDESISMLNIKDFAYYNVNDPTINPNAIIMSAFDFITCVPASCLDYVELDSNGNVRSPPLCTFMYTILVKNPSAWTLTIPVNNTMSCAQINTIFNSKDNKKYMISPQYMLTRTKQINEINTTISSAKYTEPSSYSVLPTTSNMVKKSITSNYNS